MALKTMRFLNLLLTGVLTGNEFGGLVGFHPALYELPTEAHARAERAITSRFGKIMPPFMTAAILSFVPVLSLASFWCEMWELLVIASVTPSRLGRTSCLPSSRSQHPGDGAQVSAQHAPSYPSTEARLPFIAALAQVSSTLHHADAPLHSRSVAHPPPKPPLSLVLLALFAFLAGLGQAYPIDASLLALPFVLGRVYSPVRCYEPWRLPESLLVMLEGGQ